ncbi:MAG: hypothetical protein F4239_08360 [Gammaproteobacteria bacterium]|nr:hypothetical protein [Gammaproteobacteria bacterium]MYD78880.1 hypothetical protein [Gammaproteobacteria bacterium]MYI89212.1 hypothetical protein [Gammaproteobacteria bacterium]
MHTVEAVKILAEWDQYGWNVFTLSDMRKLFPHQSEKTLSESLRRLVQKGLLQRVVNGVFVNPLSSRSRIGMFERIACAIRRGEYNYISLECALSEWGVISQIPQAYLTIVTTGRKGVFNTPYGVIEFTHTQRSALDILKNTIQRERPLRIATAQAALRDLRRVGRNLHLVDFEEMQQYEQR